MTQPVPVVHDGVLVGDAPERPDLLVGSDAWWAWLTAPTTHSFRFEDVSGPFTA